MTFYSGAGMFWLPLVFFGLLFILAGILIAIYPQILVLIVSGVLMLIGFSLVGAGLASRRAGRFSARQSSREYEIIDP